MEVKKKEEEEVEEVEEVEEGKMVEGTASSDSSSSESEERCVCVVCVGSGEGEGRGSGERERGRGRQAVTPHQVNQKKGVCGIWCVCVWGGVGGDNTVQLYRLYYSLVPRSGNEA